MITTVEGVYKKGKINLLEMPVGVDEAQVLVTFLPNSVFKPTLQHMVYGQFAGKKMSTEDDFRLAEWRGETEESNGNEAHR